MPYDLLLLAGILPLLFSQISKNLSCVKAHTRKEFLNSNFNQTAKLRLTSYSKSSFRYKTYNRNMLCICNITLPHIVGKPQILL